MLTIVRSWIPSVLSVGAGAVLCGFPAARALVSNHPSRAVCAFFTWAIITHILPSPVPNYRTPWN